MKKFELSLFVGLIAILLLMLGCGAEKSEKIIVALDTVITLKAEGDNSKEVLAEAESFIKTLDQNAGLEKNSELTKINDLKQGESLKISPEIYELLSLGKVYTEKTNKSYDISAGALVELWDAARENKQLPTLSKVEKAKSVVNSDNIILKDSKVKKTNDDAKITFGGIAKGYAADKTIALCKEHNLSGFFDFGGSTIAAIGDKNYRVGIKDPKNPAEIKGVVTIKNAALSTSGDYERFFEFNGKKYHHIIDTKTGFPADNGIASATVITPLSYENAGVMSDVFSTALMITGKENANFLPEDVSAVMITTDGVVILLNNPYWEDKLNQTKN